MHYTEVDTRLAAYVVVPDAEGRLLLSWFVGSRWDGPGWSLPGGGVFLEETFEEAAVREVREETGHEVVLEGLLCLDTWQDAGRRPRPFKTARAIYLGRVTGGTLGTLEVDGSTSHAAWVGPAELSDPTPLLARGLEAWRATPA